MKNKLQHSHMENANNKDIPKNKKLVNWIISILILLPLCFLIYTIKVKKTEASKIKSDTLTNNKIAPRDSIAIKLQAATDLARTSPNENNYINLSLEYYHNNKYKECVDATKKALEFNPKSYVAYNNMCSAYNMLGYWDDAIDAGNKALAIAPGDQLAINNLKVSKDGKAKQIKAIADVTLLLKPVPARTIILTWETYIMAQGNSKRLYLLSRKH